ncbi:complex 1 protein [Diplocarpon rosae]|nr:complex 1 protein [Diplocarpon rosae]
MRCSTLLLRQGRRAYASAAKKRPSRLDSTISLDHFIQRGRVISLWRTILRGCRRISDQNTKIETLQFARDEFRRNREVKDIGQIRYLTSTGKAQWQTMERYIDGL